MYYIQSYELELLNTPSPLFNNPTDARHWVINHLYLSFNPTIMVVI